MKFNIFKNRKDKIHNESKKIETPEKNTKEYETPIELFRDWKHKMFKNPIREELWEGWEDVSKKGYRKDAYFYHEITIEEIPIIENKTNRKKTRKNIYAHLIKKLKENKFKISTSYYIKNITHREYNKIVNKSIKELKELIDKKLFIDEFNYEISIEKESKVFHGIETIDMIKFPKLEKGDLILQIDDFVWPSSFGFVIIKEEKLIYFEYAVVVD